jgi:anti-anti-sigma factor
MPGMEITTTVADGTATIAVSGEVDMATAPALQDAIGAVVPKHPRTVVDLTASRYFDSSGLRVLITFADQLSEIVIASDGILPRIFELARLDEVLPVRRI